MDSGKLSVDLLLGWGVYGSYNKETFRTLNQLDFILNLLEWQFFVEMLAS